MGPPFAADAQVQIGAGLRPSSDAICTSLPTPTWSRLGKRIELIDLLVVVSGQELAGVVAAEAKGHLGQIVGAEGEELGLGGDLIGRQGGAGISIMVPTSYFRFDAGGGNELVGGGDHDVLDVLQLL